MPLALRHTAALQYARAILDLANLRQQPAPIADELLQLKQIIHDNPTFALFLRDPGISQAQRWQVIDRVLGPRLSPLLISVLGVLNARRRLALLPKIADAYHDLLDQQLGNIQVDVTFAADLDPRALEIVRRQLSAAFHKHAVLRHRVDDSIIGGLVVRARDKLIDASVTAYLQAIRRALAAAHKRT
jgi:F-type H+-transporting ATPase subunit delta